RLRSCSRLGAARSGGVVTAAFLPRCSGSACVGRKEGSCVRRASPGWARPFPRTGRGPDRARARLDDRLARPEHFEVGVGAVQGAQLVGEQARPELALEDAELAGRRAAGAPRLRETV